jgi:hypothetical protein
MAIGPNAGSKYEADPLMRNNRSPLIKPVMGRSGYINIQPEEQ